MKLQPNLKKQGPIRGTRNIKTGNEMVIEWYRVSGSVNEIKSTKTNMILEEALEFINLLGRVIEKELLYNFGSKLSGRKIHLKCNMHPKVMNFD